MEHCLAQRAGFSIFKQSHTLTPVKAMARPLWQVSLIKKAFPTPSTAKLTRLPLIGKLAQKLLFDKDDIVYIPINQSVPGEDNIALPSDVVRHFVKTAKFRWVMNDCICRSASNCDDYPLDIGCLFLGEATQQINPALGRLVSVEEGLAHVDRCQEAGLVHLIGRNKLDSVWLNARPGEKLLTICNCCECCCLWKILIPNAFQPIGDSVQRLEGVQVTVTDDCQACETCVDHCFVKAISMNGEKAEISGDCRGCGRCVTICPDEAIKMSIPDIGELNQKLIEKISKLVDV